MKNINFPSNGYANVYEHTFKDVTGNIHKEHLLGQICENKNEVPKYYEYDRVTHKHMGVAKVTIELEK